jgi:hypothetical protein
MSRYFTRTAVVCTPHPMDSGALLDGFGGASSMTVHEEQLETFTGIYDARGEEIHRTERIALGFKRERF